MRRWVLRLLQSCGVDIASKVISLAAVLSFVGMAILPAYAPARWELPLSIASNVVVDTAGNIYCGSQAYSQIQKYSADGRFLRRWDVGGGGPRTLRITDRGRIVAFELRGRYVDVFTLGGELVRKVAAAEWANPTYYQPDVMRNRYEMRGSIFLPGHVVRVDAEGHQTDVIRAHVWWFFFQAPFPAFLYGLLAVVPDLINRYL